MSKVYSDFAEPISSNQPEGIDIEYDARFINIQTLAEGKPEQQYGDVIIEAEAPDWSGMEKLCLQVLSESKDIRVFCFYTQAMTAMYGIKGFYKGCESLLLNLEKYWENLYPKLLDEDGEYDTFYRLGSIELLISNNGILNQLIDSNIIKTPSKKEYLTLKNVIAVLTNTGEELYPGGREKLLQDMAVAYRSNDDELLYIEKSLTILQDIEKIFSEKLAGGHLDFTIISKPLVLINNSIQETLKNIPLSIDSTEEAPLESTEETNVKNNLKTGQYFNLQSIEIKDREDVKILLDKLTLYFRIKEPSHPAPLFINRLKRLLDMDFYDILKDISPGSLNDLDIIIGKGLDSEDDSEEE